ncbi:hypothetical protein B0H16DRAFT_1614540 [Mycena metata]|uniref:Uncharacterized protein n=1 Tax=Mycena metata TaxID=1033252 RepID=A0AAD7MH94_9AGAR|nr:hypothetical protein B0H16DRAFT_1614540 [Mycena metata]
MRIMIISPRFTCAIWTGALAYVDFKSRSAAEILVFGEISEDGGLKGGRLPAIGAPNRGYVRELERSKLPVAGEISKSMPRFFAF